MGRLFWKIFLWFWLAMTLMTLGIAWGMAQIFEQESARLAKPMGRLVVPQILAVASLLESGGVPATKVFLKKLSALSPLRIFVIDDQNRELLGRTAPKVSISEFESQDSATQSLRPRRHFAGSVNHMVISAEGDHYQIMADFPLAHRALSPLRRAVWMLWPFNRDPWWASMRLGASILVSSLFCFWLAWYLAKPVKQLREASRRLSQGNLDTRVSKLIGHRRDEIADLGKDFDHMAKRLQSSASAQQQLLSDVSHELRSPLARLQVALGLARKKVGEQSSHELDRIEREASRLGDLVGQVLTLSRLEAGAKYPQEDYVDVAVLMEEITRDAEFEAVARKCHVYFRSRVSPVLKANAELLRRALENIIRNAVHYTEEDTYVEVALQNDTESKGWTKIAIFDHGPGIPEEQLPYLFKPFIRVAESRDRASGGYGLGLAIAERAIQLHGGQVSASNREGGGLCILVRFPPQDGAQKIMS